MFVLNLHTDRRYVDWCHRYLAVGRWNHTIFRTLYTRMCSSIVILLYFAVITMGSLFEQIRTVCVCGRPCTDNFGLTLLSYFFYYKSQWEHLNSVSLRYFIIDASIHSFRSRIEMTQAATSKIGKSCLFPYLFRYLHKMKISVNIFQQNYSSPISVYLRSKSSLLFYWIYCLKYIFMHIHQENFYALILILSIYTSVILLYQ